MLYLTLVILYNFFYFTYKFYKFLVLSINDCKNKKLKQKKFKLMIGRYINLLHFQK